MRVASSPTLSAYLMPGCIAACAREAPRVRFLLLDRIQQDVLESVRGGEVDFGVVVEPPDVGDLACEAVLHDPFVLVTPPGHRLARGTSVRWKALDVGELAHAPHQLDALARARLTRQAATDEQEPRQLLAEPEG